MTFASTDIHTDYSSTLSLIHQQKDKFYLTEPILIDSVYIDCDEDSCCLGCTCIAENSPRKIWFLKTLNYQVIELNLNRNVHFVLNKYKTFTFNGVKLKIKTEIDFVNGIVFYNIKIFGLNFKEIFK